jgi:hypothetical protein
VRAWHIFAGLIALLAFAIYLLSLSADDCVGRGGVFKCWGVGQNLTCECFDPGAFK